MVMFTELEVDLSIGDDNDKTTKLHLKIANTHLDSEGFSDNRKN